MKSFVISLLATAVVAWQCQSAFAQNTKASSKPVPAEAGVVISPPNQKPGGNFAPGAPSLAPRATPFDPNTGLPGGPRAIDPNTGLPAAIELRTAQGPAGGAFYAVGGGGGSIRASSSDNFPPLVIQFSS